MNKSTENTMQSDTLDTKHCNLILARAYPKNKTPRCMSPCIGAGFFLIIFVRVCLRLITSGTLIQATQSAKPDDLSLEFQAGKNINLPAAIPLRLATTGYEYLSIHVQKFQK